MINDEHSSGNSLHIRQIQRQLLEMGFDITLVNKLFTYYNITRIEQAIDYLTKIDDKWNHPFVNYSNERSVCLVCKELYEQHNTELEGGNVIKRIPSSSNLNNNQRVDSRSSRNNPNNSFENRGSHEQDIQFKGAKTCQICFEQFRPGELNMLPCKENICRSCVIEYLAAKITTSDVIEIKCPNHQCRDNYIFDEETIRRNVSEHLYNNYRKFKIRYEISKNKNLIVCPIQDCESFAFIIEPDNCNINNQDKDIKLDIDLNQNINKTKELNTKLIINAQESKDFHLCQNGHKFCKRCNQPPHPGINCEKKMEKEFNTYVNLENVKKCPKCGFFIKKDGGCNHITCGNRNCKYEFCWLCMKVYSQYHYTQPFSTCYGLNYADDRNIMVRFAVLKYIRIIGLLLIWLLVWSFIIGIVITLPSIVIAISFLVTTYKEINRVIKVKNKYLKLSAVVMFHSTYLLLSVAFLPLGYWCIALSPAIFLCYVVLFSFITGRYFGIRRRPFEVNIDNNVNELENMENMH
jgi:RNase P subunit RPR2